MNKGIQKIFTQVPKTYELVNHVLTIGFDILWRKKLAKKASEIGGRRWIDLCSGTGETAAYLQRMADQNTKVYAADFSKPMLSEALAKPEGTHIHFVLSDIQQLPFPDQTFDVITISFATRNINLSRDSLVRAFTEFYRLLKPGGSFLNLETSQPSNWLIRSLFHLYVRIFVKPLGSWLSGSEAGYAYLSKTIPRFYEAEQLSLILAEAGFKQVEFQKLLFGISALHQAGK